MVSVLCESETGENRGIVGVQGCSFSKIGLGTGEVIAPESHHAEIHEGKRKVVVELSGGLKFSLGEVVLVLIKISHSEGVVCGDKAGADADGFFQFADCVFWTLISQE